MKPSIAILPLVDTDRDSYWMLPGYMDGLMEAGALPQMMPLTVDAADIDAYLQHADGVLLPGGHDLDPALYGAVRHGACGETCGPLDGMTRIVFGRALELDLPVLGICRGLQAINVLCGGTLYQDLPSQHASAVDHHMAAPYDRVQHEVRLVEGSPLQRLLGTATLGVNSYHHQGIALLGEGLEAMATAPDGLVEAVRRPSSRFVWGVQWHPEFSYRKDAASRCILGAFVQAATGTVR